MLNWFPGDFLRAHGCVCLGCAASCALSAQPTPRSDPGWSPAARRAPTAPLRAPLRWNARISPSRQPPAMWRMMSCGWTGHDAQARKLSDIHSQHVPRTTTCPATACSKPESTFPHRCAASGEVHYPCRRSVSLMPIASHHHHAVKFFFARKRRHDEGRLQEFRNGTG